MAETTRPSRRDMLLGTAAGLAAAAGSMQLAQAQAPASGLIAIDILLEPGAAMLDRAAADNARLRANHADGFALDAAHTPHITLLQTFVDVADLPRVQEAAGRALDIAAPLAWQLTAIGRYYIPTQGLGLAGITIRPTQPMLSLQTALVEAVAPLGRSGATGAAFDGPAPPALVPQTVAYIDGFPQERTGANFNPHVTTGLGQEAFVQALVAEPFPSFEFGLTGAALFHLGILGTANRRLWTWASSPRG